MAVYTILSVDVLPECVQGNRHVAKASLMVDGAPGGVARIERLLAMAASGYAFVVAGDDESGADVAVTLASCVCGEGHVLQPGGLVDEYPARN